MTSQTQARQGTDVTVIIDIGSSCLRGGLAGEDKPRCELPTSISSDEQVALSSEPDCPIHRGCVSNWEVAESLLSAVYRRLHVQQGVAHSLLLTRHVHDPWADAEHFVQLAMEKLDAQAVYIGTQPLLALYATGSTSAVVLDCGEGVTQLVPIYQGYAINHAIQRQDLAGRDITTTLQTLLANRRPDNRQVNMCTAGNIKESTCYVLPSAAQDGVQPSSHNTRSFVLPSGDVIHVDQERFQSPEVLFQPSLIGSEYLGLPRLLHKSISMCPIDIRGHLYANIIMAGGTTKTPGICGRLLTELTSLVPRCRVRVVAGADRQLSAWRGGSVLASLPSFPQLCVSQQEFQEHGGVIVQQKFL